MDGKTAGLFHRTLKGNQPNIQGYNRRIIANEVKILARLQHKKIDAIISKDLSSIKQYIQPLIDTNQLQVKFFDLNIPLNDALGTLFPL